MMALTTLKDNSISHRLVMQRQISRIAQHNAMMDEIEERRAKICTYGCKDEGNVLDVYGMTCLATDSGDPVDDSNIFDPNTMSIDVDQPLHVLVGGSEVEEDYINQMTEERKGEDDEEGEDREEEDEDEVEDGYIDQFLKDREETQYD